MGQTLLLRGVAARRFASQALVERSVRISYSYGDSSPKLLRMSSRPYPRQSLNQSALTVVYMAQCAYVALRL